MTNPRTSHQGAIEMFWIHFSGLVRHVWFQHTTTTTQPGVTLQL